MLQNSSKLILFKGWFEVHLHVHLVLGTYHLDV